MSRPWLMDMPKKEVCSTLLFWIPRESRTKAEEYSLGSRNSRHYIRKAWRFWRQAESSSVAPVLILFVRIPYSFFVIFVNLNFLFRPQMSFLLFWIFWNFCKILMFLTSLRCGTREHYSICACRRARIQLHNCWPRRIALRPSCGRLHSGVRLHVLYHYPKKSRSRPLQKKIKWNKSDLQIRQIILFFRNTVGATHSNITPMNSFNIPIYFKYFGIRKYREFSFNSQLRCSLLQPLTCDKIFSRNQRRHLLITILVVVIQPLLLFWSQQWDIQQVAINWYLRVSAIPNSVKL